MTSIADRQAQIVADFQAIAQDERYTKIIALGRAHEGMADEMKTEANRLRGCASTAWFHAAFDGSTIRYYGEAEAIMSNGLMALMLKVYDQATPAEVLSSPADFIEAIGLNASLSPNRANGLASMAKQIRTYALAFQHMANKQ